MLKWYLALGCPELKPPAHAWYKRDGSQAVIGCEWSQTTWHLSCDGHRWSGVVGNCSGPGINEENFEELIVPQFTSLPIICQILLYTNMHMLFLFNILFINISILVLLLFSVTQTTHPERPKESSDFPLG